MKDSEKFDSSKVVDNIKKDKVLMLGVGGALAIVVGLFLPWYSVKFLGVGTSFAPGLGNGTGLLLFLLAAAAVGAALNVLSQPRDLMDKVGLAIGVVTLLVMFSNYPDSSIGSAVNIGIGYWLSFLGAVGITAYAGLRMKDSSAKK